MRRKSAWPVLRGRRRSNAPPLPDEIEVAYLALRHTLLGGYVLRSRDRAGAEQELWAPLTVYQALRMAMTAATGTVPGTNPDRASFTAALEAAREQVTSARGIDIPADPDDTAGSAAPSSRACCPPGGHATAPGR